MTPEEMRDWVAKSRAKQGLPPTIKDPVILERCAAAFRLMIPAEPAPPQQRPRRRRKPDNNVPTTTTNPEPGTGAA